MIVDTSALIAILREEGQYAALVSAINDSARPSISAGTLLEARIVAQKSADTETMMLLDAFIVAAQITVEPVTAEHAMVGAEAYRHYGKGSGHPARLNFGDCFAYALAKARNEPLLFKGNDFSHTDIEPALKSG